MSDRTTMRSIEMPPIADGWALTQLGEVADVVGGGTPATKDPSNFAPTGSGFAWLTPADLSGFEAVYIERGQRDLSPKGLKDSSARMMPSGTVLMSSRAPIGYVAIATGEIATNQGFKSFVCHDGLSPEFLFYWLTFIEPILQDLGSGSTFAEISGSRAKEIPLLLAATSEQQRIAAALGPLLERVKSSVKRLERVRWILGRFRQTAHAAACTGRLTEAWRVEHPDAEPASRLVSKLRTLHEPFGTGRRGNAAAPSDEAHDLDPATLPETWTVAELQWLCEPSRPITYGILKPGPHQPDGVQYVRVADYPAREIVLGNIRMTSRAIADAYRRSVLRTGDILLAIRGTYGRVCRVPEAIDGGNITQDTARLSIHRSVNADYVELFLRSPAVQDRLQRAAKGVAVRGVNIGDVRALQVALPPMSEQAEIVRRVRSLAAVAESIEKAVTDAGTRTRRLTQSILGKAFRGELVPTEAELAAADGRTCESAAELLERIRRERKSPARAESQSARPVSHGRRRVR